jgi:hypothetical protein
MKKEEMMSSRKILLVLVCGLFLGFTAMAAEGTSEPAALHAEGKTLLEKGDLMGAYKSLVAAAQAAPGNAEYKKDAMALKRALSIRKYLEMNKPDAKWTKLAISLHVYFLRNNVYSEALAHGRMVHEKLGNAESAAILAEVLLEMDKNAEAVQMLRALDKKHVNHETQVCLGIALARDGKKDEAKRVAAEWPAPEKAGVGVLIDYARLDVLLDRQATALQTLTGCMEMAPPSQQELIKKYIVECKDFAPIVAHADFAKVMATKSKVSESGCSGGSSCGSCPSRGSCGSATTDKKDSDSDCDSDCDSCDKSDDCKDK